MNDLLKLNNLQSDSLRLSEKLIKLSDEPIWMSLHLSAVNCLRLFVNVNYKNIELSDKKKSLLLIKYIDVNGIELQGVYGGLMYSAVKRCNYQYLSNSSDFFQCIELLNIPQLTTIVQIGFCSFYAQWPQEVFINQNLFYEKNISLHHKPILNILGSCVTRDIFNLNRLKDKYVIANYFARSSIASVVSKPFLEISKESIKLSSKFQREMVFADLSKSSLNCIINNQFDFLFIDFIDERFELLRYDNIVITNSSEFVAAELSKELLNFHFLSSKESIDLKLNAVSVFMERMTKLNILDKIILHEAYWATKYISKTSGEVCYFDHKMCNEILVHNQFLSKAYKIVKDCGVNVIRSQFNLADESNQWGLTPYHFCILYYQDIACQLDNLVKVENMVGS